MSFVAEGTTQFNGKRAIEGRFDSFTEEAVRTTGAEDTRITESGDTRITDEITFNTGIGTLTTEAIRIEFNSVAFYKRDGVWEPFVPYVKNNGLWQEPIAVYKNISGSWKRIY